MRSKSVTKKESFLLYISYLLLPFVVQIITSKIPLVSNYYSVPTIFPILLVDFNLNFSEVVPLIVGFVYAIAPAAIIGLLTLSNKFLQKVILIAGPILGTLFALYAYYIISQPCTDFGCLVRVIIPSYVYYYWTVLIALLPITWGVFKPVNNVVSLTKRTIIPALALIITYGMITSLIAYPIRAKAIKEIRQNNQEVQQYKSKMNYVVPEYLPKKVGKKVIEDIYSDNYDNKNYFSITETDTVGVHTFYSCGEDKYGYESFTLVEGLVTEQKLSLEEIYRGLSDYSRRYAGFRKVEKVNLTKGWGVYKEFQIQGASDKAGAGLFYEFNDARIEMILFETCIVSSDSLKDEMIKVANSLR